MKLKDKVAIITGGSNGIGKETALLYAKEGAAVAIVDVNEEAGKLAIDQIHEIGGKGAFFKANVAVKDEVEKAVQAIIDKYKKIDILLNNAGITNDALLKKMTAEQWANVINVNLSGVFYFTSAVVPHMLNQKSGKIINTSSVVGVYGNVGQTNYAATKAGVIGMTQTWAKELGKDGIRVNAVAPGFIKTDMVAKVPEKILESLSEKVPVRRLGEACEVANVYLFLASDDSSYVNGAVIQVDGGLTL